ncbi:hypothetical protein J6W78_09000 [bacterium]|nr:hypothetical protein [bacterium]
MTKKSLLTLVSAVLLVFMFLACDSNITKDGCTIGKSFGTHSLTTKKDVTQTCIKEIAAALFPECGWQSSEESTSDHIASLQRLDVTFGNECKDKNDADKSVKCPDFVPKSLKLTKLSGCEVYSIDPHTNCIAPCADLYFSTDNDTFKTVYAGSGYSYEDKLYNFIKSSGEGGVSLESKFVVGTNEAVFTWLEKAENGAETEKKISVEMEIADPDKCKDREGRQYYEGDLIAQGCGIMVCEETGWEIYYDHRPECTGCNPSTSDTKNWRCHDDTTVLEWCTCEKNEDSSEGSYGKWNCIDRIDLQCPPRVEECEDSEGRKYKRGDKIALECDEVYCTAAGWHPTGDPLICDVLCPDSIGDKKNWLCADGVTEVDWCECVTDEETGGKWICPDRVDLNCPTI